MTIDAGPAPEDAVPQDGPPFDAVPHLEIDETVPPRPEEEIADAVRGTDARGPAPGETPRPGG